MLRCLPLVLAALLGCANPAPVKPAPLARARTLTDEQRNEIDREYFLAVDAYAKADYEGAMRLVKQILAVDPSNRDALSLRRRISAAQKAGAP